MQGVWARYDAELPPIISIVWHPGRPVILGVDLKALRGYRASHRGSKGSRKTLGAVRGSGPCSGAPSPSYKQQHKIRGENLGWKFEKFGEFSCYEFSDPWAAANGGVTNAGLRGVWLPFQEIGRNRPFSPFFCLFRPFPEGPKSTWEIQKTEEKGLFPQISSDSLKSPSLKLPFAAPQVSFFCVFDSCQAKPAQDRDPVAILARMPVASREAGANEEHDCHSTETQRTLPY